MRVYVYIKNHTPVARRNNMRGCAYSQPQIKREQENTHKFPIFARQCKIMAWFWQTYKLRCHE